MSKLRLDPEHLRVQSFATGPAGAGQGTVRGHACSVPVPQDPYTREGPEDGGGSGDTCAQTCWGSCAASCGGSCFASCHATCHDYTCNVVQETCYEPAPR